MSKHTPEPWHYLHFMDEHLIANGRGMGESRIGATVCKENAERIVACVNACAGLTEEEIKRRLETWPLMLEALQRLMELDNLTNRGKAVEAVKFVEYALAKARATENAGGG